MSEDRNGPPKPFSVRRLRRQLDPAGIGETIGYVRSTAAYHRIKRYLAGNVRIDRESSGLRVYVKGLHRGEQSYTSLATTAATLQEAFFKLSHGHYQPQPDDILEILDDAGTILKIPVAEIHFSPRLDRLAADGQKSIELWCGRCRRRNRYSLKQLTQRLGDEASLEDLCARWIEGCDRKRAGQYRRCRPITREKMCRS